MGVLFLKTIKITWLRWSNRFVRSTGKTFSHHKMTTLWQWRSRQKQILFCDAKIFSTSKHSDESICVNTAQWTLRFSLFAPLKTRKGHRLPLSNHGLRLAGSVCGQSIIVNNMTKLFCLKATVSVSWVYWRKQRQFNANLSWSTGTPKKM